MREITRGRDIMPWTFSQPAIFRRRCTRCFRLLAAMLAVAIASSGCGPFSSAPAAALITNGSGNGDAGGTWTAHFKVLSEPWRFSFALDCSRVRAWSFDVTLEQMYPKNYFQAVPISLGWNNGQGPATTTASPTISHTGEFWFVVRASSGCSWAIRAPVG